jgi:hypothetical protein
MQHFALKVANEDLYKCINEAGKNDDMHGQELVLFVKHEDCVTLVYVREFSYPYVVSELRKKYDRGY